MGTYLIPKIGILELISKYGFKTYTQLKFGCEHKACTRCAYYSSH